MTTAAMVSLAGVTPETFHLIDENRMFNHPPSSLDAVSVDMKWQLPLLPVKPLPLKHDNQRRLQPNPPSENERTMARRESVGSSVVDRRAGKYEHRFTGWPDSDEAPG